MNDSLYHEFVEMPQWNFPIKLFKRETEQYSIGCDFHWHEQIEFFYVERGGLLLICNGKKQWLHTNDIGVVNYCQPHRSLKFMNNTSHYCIQVDLRVLSSGNWDICTKKYIAALTNSSVSFSSYIHNDKKLVETLKDIIHEYDTKSYGYELFIKSSFVNLFGLLFRNYCINEKSTIVISNNNTELNHVTQIVNYINENFNKKIILQDLSSIFLLSIPYMCRIFKKYTGSTIIEYVNQVRCQKARSLVGGGYSITDAALIVGYNDSNYFTRTFKKTFGFSPSSIK